MPEFTNEIWNIISKNYPNNGIHKKVNELVFKSQLEETTKGITLDLSQLETINPDYLNWRNNNNPNQERLLSIPIQDGKEGKLFIKSGKRRDVFATYDEATIHQISYDNNQEERITLTESDGIGYKIEGIIKDEKGGIYLIVPEVKRDYYQTASDLGQEYLGVKLQYYSPEALADIDTNSASLESKLRATKPTSAKRVPNASFEFFNACVREGSRYCEREMNPEPQKTEKSFLEASLSELPLTETRKYSRNSDERPKLRYHTTECKMTTPQRGKLEISEIERLGTGIIGTQIDLLSEESRVTLATKRNKYGELESTSIQGTVVSKEEQSVYIIKQVNGPNGPEIQMQQYYSPEISQDFIQGEYFMWSPDKLEKLYCDPRQKAGEPIKIPLENTSQFFNGIALEGAQYCQNIIAQQQQQSQLPQRGSR